MIDPRGAARKAALALCVAMLALCSCAAFAGPPFQTDDPDPVAYRHFEMYAFELSDGTTTGGTTLEVPSYEVNYGVLPNVQLHLVIPVAAVFPPNSGPINYGIGDTELGAKIRFIKETQRLPEAGIFPFVELASGNADKGLGVGKTWYRMPLWLQKSWGPADTQWTTYGGGGETIVPQTGYKNFPFAGWLVQRQINKKITVGAELYGHGAEGEAATSTRASTMLDAGGIYEFRDGFDLLFAAGRSVYGQPETYTYLALYWTWGPGGSGDTDTPDSTKGAKNMLASLARMHLR